MKVRRGSGRRGAALVITLWLVALIFVVGSAILQILTVEMRRAAIQKEANAAYYLAECGVEYVRGVAAQQSALAAASTTPRGSAMPMLTGAQLAALCQCQPTLTAYASNQPMPVGDESGAAAGYFKLKLSVVQEALPPPPTDPVITPMLGTGNAWLPTVVVESTGILGRLSDPVATRTVRATLKPVPPTPLGPCPLPPASVMLDGSGNPRDNLQPSDVSAYVPELGEASYEIVTMTDAGTAGSSQWTFDNGPDEPEVYPPTSSRAEELPPNPWWRVPDTP